MTIEILPARLANQIAAGEVVERPASVVKELVENALDAGATKIRIDIEKGGAKRIRIVDNGKGIVKEELTLALSRHATSKIKDLDDLEAIASLGFRGEALASISSVARLTLTSKPEEQEQAWQAFAEGRDMAVNVQPAAHPNGTTVDVVDLFFNTPARRKFLRTEKTEFSHIEEVIKRIALARFDVSFILTHNGKQVRHYRQCQNRDSYAKRVAQVCGQAFIGQALEVQSEHHDIKLWGWIAHPEFTRSQNDLCYSYVNGRMMRDKLINHAIKQSYSEWLLPEQYPAFVLFLELDYKEVDVNVHPAKHEVRFHQGRYVHDFIYSVCHGALAQHCSPALVDEQVIQPISEQSADRDYVTPLQSREPEQNYQSQQPYQSPQHGQSHHKASSYAGNHMPPSRQPVSRQAQENYQRLMTPVQPANESTPDASIDAGQPTPKLLTIVRGDFGLYTDNDVLRVFHAPTLAKKSQLKMLEEKWATGLVSQPLLLPIKINIEQNQVALLSEFDQLFRQSGIVLTYQQGVVIKQFPALFRDHNISEFFTNSLIYLDQLSDVQRQPNTVEMYWLEFLASALVVNASDLSHFLPVWQQLQNQHLDDFSAYLALNSQVVDLTSSTSQLST